MTNSVPYLVQKPGKNGPRWFWQPGAKLRAAGWKTTRLSDDRKEARQQAQDMNAELDQRRKDTGLVYPPVDAGSLAPPVLQAGSVNQLILEYKTSSRFLELAPSTQRTYDQGLVRIAAAWGDAPAAALSRKLIQDFYDRLRQHSPAVANNVIRTLRILLSFGVDQGYLDGNPASKPRMKGLKKTDNLWTAEHVEIMVRTADAMGLHGMGTAILINSWMGQRLGDILALSWLRYRDGCFHIEQNKTRARVELPVDDVPALRDRLAEERARNQARSVPQTRVIINDRTGRPWPSITYFSATFQQIRNQAVLENPDCPGLDRVLFRSLRHSAVTWLAEAGCETAQIAAITGHSLDSAQRIIDIYLIRTKQLAKSAFALRLRTGKQKTGPRKAP